MKKIFLTLLILLFNSYLFCQGSISFNWISSDTDNASVNLGPGGVFYWENPNGSIIYLYGGTEGSSMVLRSSKDKTGDVALSMGKNRAFQWFADISDPAYGMNGEPPYYLNGMITGGTAAFEMDLIGFEGIPDTTLLFTAELVSSTKNGNPLNATIYGQGDQLGFPSPGTISYETGWLSSDILYLSNGKELVVGGFYLNSSGDPTEFYFEINPPNVEVGFTIGEPYVFVHDINQPRNGNNVRFEIENGIVEKELVVDLGEVFEIIPTLTQWGVIILVLLILAVGMVFIYKRQVSLAYAGGAVESARQTKTFLFDKRLFAKVFGITLMAGLAFLVFSYLIFGKITAADPFGTFVSAAIIAYMIQYMMLRRKQ